MKKSLKRSMVLLCITAMASLSFAQNTITGQVKDENGEPVIGASVMVDGKTAAITDLDGNFKISAKPSDVVDVSYVGYKNGSVKVGNQTNLSISLQPDNQTLDDVVVIGYGSVKKGNLTSAVAKMSGESIKDRPLARAEQALQGQLAGVQTRITNGEPGADMQIRVRGAASVNASSDPLYVVDGVPMTTISSLNPADIESMEVLKDAASAAIYGSRGSNGVVIVTTKRGKNGKPTITFNATVGFQRPEKELDIMTAREWMKFKMRWNDANYLQYCKQHGINGASIKDDSATRLANVGIKAGTSQSGLYINDDRWFQYLDAETQAAHTYDSNVGQLALLDWQDKMFRSASIRDYNVGIQGGTDNLNYLVSGGYMKQDGLIVNTDYQRINFRAKVESKINKYFTVGLNLAPTYIVSNNTGTANGKDSEIHHLLAMTPVAEPDAGYYTNSEGHNKYFWGGSSASPLAMMEGIMNRNRDMRLVGNGFIRITPLDGLKVELSAAATYFDRDNSYYMTSGAQSTWAEGEGVHSRGRHQTQRQWTTLLQALVNYDKQFGKHGVSLMYGMSTEQSNIGASTDQYFRNNFPNDAVRKSFDGSLLTVYTNKVTELTPSRMESFFGRASYDYDGRYMLSASLRTDGGSVFGSDHKWGTFPAVSAGWMISNEKFWKNSPMSSWWDTLKLRASYGVTGNNQIDATAAYSTLTSAVYAGMSGYYANTIANKDLSWEKTHSTDLALDFGFLHNRLQFSVDWYTKTTKDLLYEVPVVGASGFTTAWDNLGDIKNWGLEFEATSHNFVGAFKWSTSFNIAYNHNEVKSLGSDDTPIYSGWNGVGDNGNTSNVLMVGHPANAFYMLHAIGVWKSQAEIDAYAQQVGVSRLTFNGGTTIKPGDIRYEDVNGDGDFSYKNDRVFLGQPTPKVTFGLTNTFQWKGFDASILITGQFGGQIYGAFGRAIDRPSMGALGNVMDCWTNAWWSEDEPGDGKTPYILSTTTGGTCDSRWLWSSDYVSLKNVTVGYTVPLKSKFISNLRFFVSLENLYRYDHYYNGFSPEAANTAKSGVPGGTTALGLDYGGYPTAKSYNFGINLTF